MPPSIRQATNATRAPVPPRKLTAQLVRKQAAGLVYREGAGKGSFRITPFSRFRVNM